MALLAVLNHGDQSWNGNYAQIEFHSYNERYEGSYPNLYFCFDVQARIVAINSGWWMIQANTTFNYGGVQRTHGIYTGKVYGASGWYFVGSHRKPCGCGRSFKFDDGCSVSGYPNLSGNGSITSPTIGAPAFTARAENIDQRTCDIVWDTTDNPYNMYRMYVKDPNGTYSSQLPMDGRYSLKGLSSNTSYTYRVEAWQADGRGSEVAGKDVTFKTLENYPEISVTEVTYEIEDAGETDNVTFRFKSTDDSHVSKWHYQIQGGPPFSGASPTYTESKLAKNLESYIDVWTEDTLGRTSSKFRQSFHTTFTKMTVWRRMKTNGYQLFDASKLPTKSQGGATVTNNNDGSFTISGSGNLTERYVSDTPYTDIPFKLKAGKLCVKTENIVYPSAYIDFAGDEGFITSISIRSGDDSAEIELTSEQVRKIKKYGPLFVGNANEPIRTGTIKPMLYQDGDGTWEPFTGGKPFDGYLRGFMYCIQNMLWGYARPYILNAGRKWLNALPYDIVRRFVFSGKTNAAGLEIHKIYGKTVQETTKGYQLFDASKFQTSSNGGATVTNNNDGSFTITGSGSLTKAFTIDGGSFPIKLKPGKLYLKVERATTPYVFVDFYYNDNNYAFTLLTKSGNFQVRTISEDEASRISRAHYYILGKINEGIVPGTIKPMLYQDGDGTWEQYTGGKPGPNPDGAIPIQNVEIKNIESRNKNLFGGEALKNKIIELGGTDFTNNSVIISASKIRGKVVFNSFKKDTQYTIILYGKCTNSEFLATNMEVVYTDESSESMLFSKKDEYSYCVFKSNIDKTIKEISGIWDSRETILEQDKCGIFEGSIELDDFISYKEASVQTNLILAKGEVYEKGQPIVRKRKKAVFDGSDDEQWQIFQNGEINQLFIILSDIKHDKENPTVYSNRFIASVFDDRNSKKEIVYSVTDGFGINTDVAKSVSDWKTWLKSHPVEIEYELQSPTTESLTIPIITSFDPYTNVWTDSEVETQIEWRPAASSTLTERFYAVEQYRKVLNENT